MKKRILFAGLFLPVFCLLSCLLLAGVSRAADGDVGKVITLTPGVFVERDGARTPLALNDPVRNTDTLITDDTGRARILFHDDGAVTLGPNTSLALVEVLPEGDAPTFKAHVAQGLARFITGRIVEQNPKGFSVSTPEGTAGIRGTIFVLQTGNGQTTLYVVNATRDVVLNDVSVPSGFKMSLPGGSPVPMTPADVAVTQTVAAAPSSSTESAAPEQAVAASLDTGDSLASTALADLGLAAQTLGDALAATPLTASVAGTLSSNDSSATFSAVFGFDVDLSSGFISGAYVNGSGSAKPGFSFIYDTLTVNVTGGIGLADASVYAVTNYTGTVQFGTVPPDPSPTIALTGPITLSDFNTLPSGASIPVSTYTITGSSGLYDYGSGSGTLSK
jgi:hypothetical protein